jgi:hypothetical protein
MTARVAMMHSAVASDPLVCIALFYRGGEAIERWISRAQKQFRSE